jgi:hypothetical protein
METGKNSRGEPVLQGKIERAPIHSDTGVGFGEVSRVKLCFVEMKSPENMMTSRSPE